MREPPADLSIDLLVATLSTDYGLAIADLTFLPLGHDSSAWVYRAEAADRHAYFAKVRKSLTNEAALIVPHYLADSGVTRVVAPLTAMRGGLWVPVAHYALIVYPYVSDRTGMFHDMSDRQWVEYGSTLRAIHEVAIPPGLRRRLRVDSCVPDGAEMLRRLAKHTVGQSFDNPGQARIASFWVEHGSLIDLVLDGAKALGKRVAAARPPVVLCHADIHTNNVLLDGDQHIAIVDWDETLLAPRERDLMFVAGGIGPDFVNPRQEGLFFKGYGAVDIDPVALAYYRYAWAISDIAAYGDQVFFRPDLGPRDLMEAVERFQSLFEAGSIVDIALGSKLG